MNLPNALTMIRMLLIPVFAWAYFNDPPGVKVAIVVFLLASATDWLDGFLARRWNQVTSFGKLFDPLADKLMLLTALYCLAYTGNVPWWTLILMAAKEGFMVAGSLFMLNKKVVVSSNMFGKVATVLFIAAVVLLFPWHGNPALHIAGTVMLYAALTASIVAFFAYSAQMLRGRGVKSV